MTGRLLGQAEGNPLALLELPAALGSSARGGEAPLPGRLPLTARLERAFAARAAELPPATRTLLQIASADDGSELAEILRAAQPASGPRSPIADLDPGATRHGEPGRDGVIAWRCDGARCVLYVGPLTGSWPGTLVLARDTELPASPRSSVLTGSESRPASSFGWPCTCST